jgi:hypothetical protein
VHRVNLSPRLFKRLTVDEIGKITLEVLGIKEKRLWTVEHFDGRTSLRAEKELGAVSGMRKKSILPFA